MPHVNASGNILVGFNICGTKLTANIMKISPRINFPVIRYIYYDDRCALLSG